LNPFESLMKPLLSLFPELDEEDLSFGPAPNLDLGDVAVPMFLAARKLKAAPPQLANRAASDAVFGPEVQSAHATGPYLNLKLNRSHVGRGIVQAALRQGKAFGANGAGTGKKVLIEHTSINPNASPHVGRARNAMIGDSLSRLLRFEDYEVEVHYYVNDMGRQIGLLVMIADELENLSFDQVLDAYVEANERAKTDEDFAEQGYSLLVKMEQGDQETQERFQAVTDLCLAGQLAVLERIGASYDVFDRESKYVGDPRIEEIIGALRKKDAVFTDEDQRLVVDLSKLGHKPEEGRYFVLLRANGSSLYGCRDLAYSVDKLGRGADVNLMVLGEDHKLYAQQLGMMLETAGHAVAEPIYYSYIVLKDGKMSTREGKVVLLSDFLDQAAALAEERVAAQCAELSPEERKNIAEQVAVAAIRFAVLRVSPNKNVTFDMDAALSFQGDTGPYIQYSCARIRSILRKSGQETPHEVEENFQADSNAEWALLSKLAAFPQVAATALRQRTVANIATYALELAHAFTTFYHDCPVLQAQEARQRIARLQICQATLQTLENALSILGIEAPERM
jgi:arginyl-tRNA synthetase